MRERVKWTDGPTSAKRLQFFSGRVKNVLILFPINCCVCAFSFFLSFFPSFLFFPLSLRTQVDEMESRNFSSVHKPNRCRKKAADNNVISLQIPRLVFYLYVLKYTYAAGKNWLEDYSFELKEKRLATVY